MGLIFSTISSVNRWLLCLFSGEDKDTIESPKERLVSQADNNEAPSKEETLISKADNEEASSKEEVETLISIADNKEVEEEETPPKEETPISIADNKEVEEEIPPKEEMSSKKDKVPKWKVFADMPTQEKRKHYKCGDNYVRVNDIETWTQYFDSQSYYFHSKVSKPDKKAFQFNKDLNEKISLWRGDITTLEIDAIVNAANKSLLGGGGVDGCIHRAAGPTLVEECRSLNGCETGHTKITSGHKLPAKFVLHTVGPIGEQEKKLESCYKTCLQLCLDREIRTVAFCCVSTGIYGYPNRNAAEVALRTSREWLEKNADKVDRIIFCLFLQKDIDIYHSLMLKYFPPREEEDIRESEQKRAKMKKEKIQEEAAISSEDITQASKKHKQDKESELVSNIQDEDEDEDENSAVERFQLGDLATAQLGEDLSEVSSEEPTKNTVEMSTESQTKECAKKEKSEASSEELSKDSRVTSAGNFQKEVFKETSSGDENSGEFVKDPVFTTTTETEQKDISMVDIGEEYSRNKEKVQQVTMPTQNEPLKMVEGGTKDPGLMSTENDQEDPLKEMANEKDSSEKSVKAPDTMMTEAEENKPSVMVEGGPDNSSEQNQDTTTTEAELPKSTGNDSPMDVTD